MNLSCKKNNIDVLLVVMILAMAFENFKIFNLLGAPIKITHLVFLLAILKSLFWKIAKQQFTLKSLSLLFLWCAIPLLPVYRLADTTEFFKTYMVYLIMVFFMTFSYSDYYKRFEENQKKYIYLFLWMMLIIQILGIIQFICMNFFDYFFLEGIWGSFQFHSSIFGMQSGLYRAYSIFHEPSLFGWMSTTSFAICIYVKRKNYLKRFYFYLFQLFNLIAVGVSVSASSLIMLLIIYIVSIILESKKPVNFMVNIILGLIVCGLLWRFTHIFDSLGRVNNEFSRSGTSGYERLNTPFKYVVSTLENYPLLGRGLGQEGSIDNVGVIGLYKGVNNSLFGIFVNLGLSAIIYLSYFIYYFIRKLRYSRDYLLLIIALFGIYVSTGAYIALDTFVVFVFVLFIGDLTQKNKQHLIVKRGN
ncbi:hypothetical protein [Priestia megaterium]|uniref:hypothetical protein n=1 Tax=Priestia megaterium TaxID=1404 RepID=UPI003879B441